MDQASNNSGLIFSGSTGSLIPNTAMDESLQAEIDESTPASRATTTVVAELPKITYGFSPDIIKLLQLSNRREDVTQTTFQTREIDQPKPLAMGSFRYPVGIGPGLASAISCATGMLSDEFLKASLYLKITAFYRLIFTKPFQRQTWSVLPLISSFQTMSVNSPGITGTHQRAEVPPCGITSSSSNL